MKPEMRHRFGDSELVYHEESNESVLRLS